MTPRTLLAHRATPRAGMIAAAVLSTMAIADATRPPKIVSIGTAPAEKDAPAKKLHADATPPKKDLAIANFQIALHADTKKADAVAKKLPIGSVMNGHVIQLDARTILAGRKQHGPRYGAGKKVDVADALSHEFGGLHVAHHLEPLATAGMKRRGERLLVN